MFASHAERVLAEKQSYALFPEIELWVGGPITRLRDSCHRVKGYLVKADLLFTMSRQLRDLMRSVGAYAVHVADVFIALRDVVAVISQGIVSDEPGNLDNYTALLREKRLLLHSRIDEALDARDDANATLLALEEAVEDRLTFAHDPCASFLNSVLDWIYPFDNQNRDPLQFAAEARTLHERINDIEALLEKMAMLVQGIPQRFSLDKVVEIRQLPDDERIRVVSGVRQADTKLELLDWRGRGLGRNLIQYADYIPLHE